MPKILNYHFLSQSFKFIFLIVVVLCLHTSHSIRCSFTNIMTRQDTVGATRRPSNSGSGDKNGPEFICYVGGRQPEIHEGCTFGEDGVTPEVHLTVHIDVSAFVGKSFATNYLTLTWRRMPMFGRNYINGSVEWLGVPNFLRNYGPPWTLNLLAPYANWWDRGSSTIPSFGGYSCPCPSNLPPEDL